MRHYILCSAITAIALLLNISVTATASDLEFFVDLDSAKADNVNSNPYVLYFGASWCGPCQQMKAITFEAVGDTDQAANYQWLKFDVDDSPEIATRYGIFSVPSIIVLDGEMNAVGGSSGFMSADQLLEFIEESLANPQQLPATLQDLAIKLRDAADTEELVESVRFVLAELADRSRPNRDEILQLLASQPASTQSVMLGSLGDESLAIRAAATEVLSLHRNQSIRFDPFESSEVRTEQFRKLKSTWPTQYNNDAPASE